MAFIYLIRHGQASLGMSNYDELSETGIEQSKVLGAELLKRGITFDKIFSGTMQRHRQTAAHCLQAMNLQTAIETDAAWNEFDHMDIIAKYEPRYSDTGEIIKDISAAENPKQKIMHMLMSAFSRWTEGRHDDYNEGWSSFCQRVEGGILRLQQQLNKKQKAVVFTSGGPVCIVMRKILGLTPEKTMELQLNLANASVCQFKNSSRGLQLIAFNDHGYFTGEHKHLLTWR